MPDRFRADLDLVNVHQAMHFRHEEFRFNRMFRTVTGTDDPNFAVNHRLARAAITKFECSRVFFLCE